MTRFKEKVIIITGAAGGIGNEVFRKWPYLDFKR